MKKTRTAEAMYFRIDGDVAGEFYKICARLGVTPDQVLREFVELMVQSDRGE